MTPQEALARALADAGTGRLGAGWDSRAVDEYAEAVLPALATLGYEVRPKEEVLRAALERLASGAAIAGVPVFHYSDENTSPPSALWRELRATQQYARDALAATPAPPDPLDVEAARRGTFNRLSRWINHDRDCPGRFGDPQPCGCGLRAALVEIGVAADAPPEEPKP